MENSERNFELEENQKEDAVYTYEYDKTYYKTYDTTYSDTLVRNVYKCRSLYENLWEQIRNKEIERQYENRAYKRYPRKRAHKRYPEFRFQIAIL